MSKYGQSRGKKLPKYLEKGEVENILERAENDSRRNYLILLTMWRTGMRLSELTSLRKEDINFSDGSIIVRAGKGGKDRMIPLHKELKLTLGFYLDGLGGSETVFPLSNRWIQQIVKKYTDKEWVSPHTFRHSFAVHCLKSGMNLRSVQKILGHGDLSVTQIYLDITGDDVKEDFEKVD